MGQLLSTRLKGSLGADRRYDQVSIGKFVDEILVRSQAYAGCAGAVPFDL